MTEIIKKKRGRKPKNIILTSTNKNIIYEDIIISEEEQIILHLPISLDKLNNDNSSIFIKNE